MPDFDTGHLFLTYLAPIKIGSPRNGDPSYEQNVRIALAKLPPAHQSPATVGARFNSPFARNTRNHLARMFVLDDVVYNGRTGENPLVSAAKGVDTIDPLPVDDMNCPYLVFTADIDAITKDGDPLPKTLSESGQKKVRLAYAQLLWDTMGEEIQAIFSNCHGFETVTDGASFGQYLERCHVETTMPFHDYYLKLPSFNILPLKSVLLAVAAPLVATLVLLLLRILGLQSLWGLNTLLLTGVAALVTALAAFLAVRFVLANGEKPLAPAEYDDLPSVLKALHCQQAFTVFATDMQGRDDDALHAAFGEFLETHAPSDKSGPTQQPGVIASAFRAG
jgi:hypothetical protein